MTRRLAALTGDERNAVYLAEAPDGAVVAWIHVHEVRVLEMDVHAEIRAAGGEVHESVKKTTTHLVAGEKTGKSKLDQAKKFGTKVVDEKELERMIAGSSPQ